MPFKAIERTAPVKTLREFQVLLMGYVFSVEKVESGNVSLYGVDISHRVEVGEVARDGIYLVRLEFQFPGQFSIGSFEPELVFKSRVSGIEHSVPFIVDRDRMAEVQSYCILGDYELTIKFCSTHRQYWEWERTLYRL
ncbi:MAG: hypothetical protein KBC15_02390 [Candidatus Levybacteria bacterium]|nr:hypothetical protein [Candidatus Levybacteria bacterium]